MGKFKAVDFGVNRELVTVELTSDKTILWLVNAIQNGPEDDKSFLLEKLSSIIIHKTTTGINIWSPSSATVLTLTNLIKNESSHGHTKEFKTCVNVILQIAPVVKLLCENRRLLSEVFVNVLKIADTIPTSEEFAIFLCLESFYHRLNTREATVESFVKLALPTLGNFYAAVLRDENVENCQRRKRVINFCENMIFTKTLIPELITLIGNVFEGKSENFKFPLFHSLHSCLQSDLEEETKLALVRLIVEALIASGKIDDIVIIRFVILLGHLLSVEQMVAVACDGDSRPLLDASHVSAILGVEVTLMEPNFAIWNSVLNLVSSKSLILSESLPRVTGLQWFQALTAHLVSRRKKFSHCHIHALKCLFHLDSLIIEPYLAKIFSCVFAKSSRLSKPLFLNEFSDFMAAALHIFSRLQRCHKFLAKLLRSLTTVANIDPEKILSPTFLDDLSSTMTVLPSAHNLSILTALLDHLEQAIEDLDHGEVNTTLLQVVGNLLSSCFGSCRLLSYIFPRSVVEAFIRLIDRLKDLLARFSGAILLRPHDRRIMQPFLRACLIWGELQVLVNCYAIGQNLPELPEDSSPCDLSPLLNFVNGEQWSVFAERITNFGDEQCNRCFMKLILQKLKVSQLIGGKSQVNTVATAKYVLTRFKVDIHGLTVGNVLTPEELSTVLHCLPHDEAEAMVSVLYEQLNNGDSESLSRWLTNPILLENKKFVLFVFYAAFKFLVHSIPKESIPTGVDNLYRSLKEIGTSSLSTVHADMLREEINEAFRTVLNQTPKPIANYHLERVLHGLRSLPVPFIAGTLEGASLSSLTALLVILDGAESILPLFESLLKATSDISTCFDIGLCIHWIMTRVSDSTIRNAIIELLVIKSMSSENGVAQFKKLIKSFKESSNLPYRLEVEVILYNCIRKCWGQGKKNEEKNTMLAAQRKHLVRRLRCGLSESKLDDGSSSVFDAFAILLMIKDRQGKIEDVIDMNFDGHLQKAIDGVKTLPTTGDSNRASCLNFLQTVLKCSAALRPAVKYNLVYKIWSELRLRDCDKLWTLISTAATDEEYRDILGDLVWNIKAALGPPQLEDVEWINGPVLPKRLRPLFVKDRRSADACPWPRAFVDVFRSLSTQATDSKLLLWEKALLVLFDQSDCILPHSRENGDILNWLKFLSFVSTSAKVTMTSEIQDYILDVLVTAPTDGVPFLEHFVVRTDILAGLIGPRTTLFREKIHLIFQIFKILLDWLVGQSDANFKFSDSEGADRAQAAFHLEKWCSIFIQKDVGREITLFIIEIITSLTAVALSVPVKMHLNNAVFILLRQADEYAVQFLMRMLPQGSQFIFSNLYSQYRRFYKYKGKI